MTANCLDSTESNNTNTCGESISSLFIRACDFGPKDALKTSAAPAPPQARRTRPSHKQAPPYAHYLARAAGRKARRVPPVQKQGLSGLVFIGASHTGRMAALLGLGEQVLYLSLPIQTELKASVDNMAEKLSDMPLTNHDALILDTFSSWTVAEVAGGSAPTPTKSVRISTNLEIQKW